MNRQEQRAYQRGYAAGRKRGEADARAASIKVGEREFWERAVLTVAPYFMGCDPWTRGEKKLTTLDDRAGLCVKFANFVVRARRDL